MKKLKKILFVSTILVVGLFYNAITVSAETTLNCKKTLKYSMNKSEQVKILQKELNTVMNCGIATDGIFGTATKSCVLKFQKANKLSQDAIVGPKTCSKLNEIYLAKLNANNEKEEQNNLVLTTTTTLKRDSKGNQVKILQEMLDKTTNCNLKINGKYDGNFGYKTEWCVKKYQEEHNLDIDGKVGPATRKSLNNNLPIVKKADFLTITASTTLNVRADATTKSKKLSTVKSKEVYQILDSKADSNGTTWYKIEYKTGNFGYISGKYTAKAQNFILLDISEQNLKLYKKGKVILNVPVVTGNVSEGNDTPTGHYFIGTKLGPETYPDRVHLSKYDAYVTYWMPFIGGSYGFHDADWRTPEQLTNKKWYLKKGSHGCVNMFMADANFLYYNIEKELAVTIVEKVYY